MGDDGVGIYVVRMLKDMIRAGTDVEFKELSVGGLRLVEEMLGYDRVIMIDSMSSNDVKPGRIREFRSEQFKETLQVSSPHVTNFATALELYKKLEPDAIPRTIRIFTIDIKPEFIFGEGLSPPVQEAASKLVDQIVREIK